jgi:DNA-binding transcriptional ArsR family regulator
MSSEPTFEEGVEALLAAPVDQAHAELVDATRGRGAEVGHRLLDDPDRAKSEAADALRLLWKTVVEPEWPSMRQALRAEMLERAIQVNREGLRAVLPRLHPSAACEGDTITVDKGVDIDIDCPEGLILVPSLFITNRIQCTTSDHWTPAIYYPASGRYLWAAPATPRSLDRLLGATRSRILAALDTPLQTTVVAELVGVTPPTASEHLAILRGAGLIDSSRAGRTAIHELTQAGRALLVAASSNRKS